MNLNTRQMRAFAAVARLRNFTRAAEEVHITQAGLSLMLRDMEAQLGCRLFERTTRTVRLTPAGTQLLPVAERVLRELDDVCGRLGEMASHGARLIKVAATPLVSAEVLPAVCTTLETATPPVRVIIRDTERSQVRQMVESGEADIGLGILFKDSTTLHSEKLLKIPLVCVSPRNTARAGFRLDRRGASVPWSRLAKVPLLGLPPDNAIQQVIDHQLRALGRANESRPTFSHLHTLLAMAEAGHGVAILPSFVRAVRSRYDVHFDVMGSPSVSMEFFSIRRRGSEPPGCLASFLSAFTEQLSLYQ